MNSSFQSWEKTWLMINNRILEYFDKVRINTILTCLLRNKINKNMRHA